MQATVYGRVSSVKRETWESNGKPGSRTTLGISVNDGADTTLITIEPQHARSVEGLTFGIEVVVPVEVSAFGRKIGDRVAGELMCRSAGEVQRLAQAAA